MRTKPLATMIALLLLTFQQQADSRCQCLAGMPGYASTTAPSSNDDSARVLQNARPDDATGSLGTMSAAGYASVARAMQYAQVSHAPGFASVNRSSTRSTPVASARHDHARDTAGYASAGRSSKSDIPADSPRHTAADTAGYASVGRSSEHLAAAALLRYDGGGDPGYATADHSQRPTIPTHSPRYHSMSSEAGYASVNRLFANPASAPSPKYTIRSCAPMYSDLSHIPEYVGTGMGLDPAPAAETPPPNPIGVIPSPGRGSTVHAPEDTNLASATEPLQPVAWQAPLPDRRSADDNPIPTGPADSGGPGGYRAGCRDDCDSGCPVSLGGACGPTWQWFADYLCLRPRDAEVVYAAPLNPSYGSPPSVPVQIGRMGMVDFDYESAFRVGFARAVRDAAAVATTYTHFESNGADRLLVESPLLVRSAVAHPSTVDGSSDSLGASGAASIDFDLVDVDYRRCVAADECGSLSYLIGARYTYLEQSFASEFALSGPETVLTQIHFDGGGLRLGLEGERALPNSRLAFYGRGAASFVAGEFDAIFTQGTAGDASVVNTRWSAGRIISILDLELGLALTSRSGRLRLSAGYMISSWGNVVKTDDLIRAVQRNNFVDLGDTLTFDGLVARAECRF